MLHDSTTVDASTTTTPVIAARGLTKRYGDMVAVDRLDLEIRQGEVFGLLGPNGAGKTTTILMLLGLTEPSDGTVEVLGHDPRHHALTVKSLVGYLPDAVDFYDDMTGRQNLRYTARLNRLSAGDADQRIEEVLDIVGLADAADRRTSGYSRGMRQRLGIADALLKRPRVLILDEPTVNIDPTGVEQVLGLVRRLADDGVTVLLSSHLLHQVQAVCDRIGVFVGGRLMAAGSIDELAADVDDGVTIEVDVDGDRRQAAELLRALDGVASVDATGERLLVSADRDVRCELVDLLHDHGLRPVHLRTAAAEIDSIYRRYFRVDEPLAETSEGASP